MRVTIRTITIPGGKGRAALHKAVVYMTTELEATPLMTSEWTQREPEAFMAAQTWARRNTYIVSNPRTGTFYGSPAGR